MPERIVITGMGTINPLAHNVADTWMTVLAGESGVGPITLFDSSDLLVHAVCEVKDFDPADFMSARTPAAAIATSSSARLPFSKRWMTRDLWWISSTQPEWVSSSPPPLAGSTRYSPLSSTSTRARPGVLTRFLFRCSCLMELLDWQRSITASRGRPCL